MSPLPLGATQLPHRERLTTSSLLPLRTKRFSPRLQLLVSTYTPSSQETLREKPFINYLPFTSTDLMSTCNSDLRMNLKPPFPNTRMKRVEKCPPPPFWQLFRPCDLLSHPWRPHRLTDNADRHLTPISHWLDSLALQLAPSNHHRAAYLHLTRFRNTHTNTHTQTRTL